VNIVHVGAHQDDEARALGALLRYRRLGHRITFICTTNGDKGFSFDTETPYEEVARVRDREMRAVAAGLDADYICLGEPDEYLYDSKEVRLKLIDALRASRADLIFTDWTEEYNADHSVTAQLVLQCALLTVIASIRTEHAALPETPKIFHCDPGPGFGFEGTHFVALSPETVDEKVRLINLHESQMAIMRSFGGDWAEAHRAHCREVGARVGTPYAEVFRPCLASRRIPLASLLPGGEP
jgi:LmbE family N-acetylglucosaminyl deacetylase